MPVIAGQQSKFAVLKIDDDSSSSSDDDGKKLIQKTSTKARRSGGSKKAGGDGSKSGLLVHVVPPKPKQKGKKAKKPQAQVLDSNGFIVQDADEDYAERKFREDLREALKMSVEIDGSSSATKQQQQRASITAETSTSKEVTEESESQKDPTEVLIADLDKQATALITGKTKVDGNRDKQLIAIYRNRLLETLTQLGIQTEAFTKADAEAKKYRNRYKRICELLKDAEVNEKAHMAAELEKAHKVENELGAQIGELQGELMQARSRIHELEAKLRQFESKH